MVTYRPPKGNNVLFNFTESGYVAPDFVNIDFLSAAYSTSDLQAAITVLQFFYHDTKDLEASIEVWPLFQDYTYTYVKNCKKIVVGYDDLGIQVLELPCLFGGIRDLGSYIYCGKVGYADLLADIIGETNIFSDLGASVKALYHSYSDLLTTLQTIPYVDLSALLKVTEIKDLATLINGIFFKGQVDLPVGFGKVTFKGTSNLATTLTSWHLSDLSTTIRSLHFYDLSAGIFAGNFNIYKNLSAFLSCVLPVDLQAELHGYAAADLNAITIVGYQPYDLPTNIRAIRPRDFPAYIYGMKAQNAYTNLYASIRGFATMDIQAYIDAVGSSSFEAYIVATGKYLDLLAEIVPKTINIKKILSISLYEHKDLRAVINYNCFKSTFRDLSAYLYPINKLDLGAFIIGWYGNGADNVIDLQAHINVSEFLQTNFITSHGNVYEAVPKFVTHRVYSEAKPVTYKIFNTMMVIGGQSTNILKATITGILYSRDLTASITAKPLANFTTVPSWVNPKTLEVVINLNRFEERWRRFVEMMFYTNSDEDYHFFYVPNDNKVYKVDRSRTWKVQVIGFSTDPDKLNSRIKTKKLFVFNVKKYRTFDSALNDLIDRVAMSRHYNLEALINATQYPFTDLPASLNVRSIKRWSISCKATITGILSNFRTLSATITPKIYSSNNNLTALIVGKAYEPPQSTEIHFNFDDPTYVSPGSYNNMNWTHIQAEDFWKV